MKNINVKSLIVGLWVGILFSILVSFIVQPFGYSYDRKEKIITFTTDEIVSDYETVERRVGNDDYGTTFKVYFDKE